LNKSNALNKKKLNNNVNVPTRKTKFLFTK